MAWRNRISNGPLLTLAFKFGVRHTDTIGVPFADLPVSNPIPLGGDSFKVTFAPPATPPHFYYLTIALQ